MADAKRVHEWSDDCPSRGPALSHRHWRSCREEHKPIHFGNQCCHCQARMGDEILPKREAGDPVELEKWLEERLKFHAWRTQQLDDWGS